MKVSKGLVGLGAIITLGTGLAMAGITIWACIHS
jgi:hypothetical protein